MNNLLTTVSRIIQSRFFLLFLFFITFLIYIPVIDGHKIWDDYYIINEMSGVSYWQIVTDYNWFIYRLITTSLTRLFGHNLVLFHSLNIVIHLLNGLLLWKVLTMLKIDFKKLILAIFLLHPMQVLNVAWMTQLKTLMAASFVLLASITYLYYCQRKSGHQYRWLIMSLLLFFISLKTKSSFIALPAVAFLYHLIYERGKDRLIKTVLTLPYLFVCLLALMQLFSSPTEVQNNTPKKHPIALQMELKYKVAPYKALNAAKVLLVPEIVWHYTKTTLFPWFVSPLYPNTQLNLLRSMALYLLFVILLLAIILSRNQQVLLGLFLAFFSIFPVLGFKLPLFMEAYQYSDHHAYLFIVGFTISLFGILKQFIKRREILQLATLIVVIILGIKSAVYIPYYKNENVFFAKAIDTNPHCMSAYTAKFTGHILRDEYPQALETLLQARALFHHATYLQKQFFYLSIPNLKRHVDVPYEVEKEALRIHQKN
jgi:hypothetical protein